MVLLAVLLLSGALGYRGHSGEMAIIVAGLFGVGAITIVFRSPTIGIVLVIVTGLVAPLGFETGTNTRVSISLVLVIVMIAQWLGHALVKRTNPLPASRTVAPLLGFLAIAVLAFGFGQQPWLAFAESAPMRAQLGGLATFLLSGAAFLLAATQLKSGSSLRLVTWVFIGIGGAIALGRFLPELSGVVGQLAPKVLTSSLFWTWLAALAFAQALLNKELKSSARLLLIGVVVAIFFTNAFHTTRWVSGWIPPLIAVLAVTLIAFPKPAMIAGLSSLVLGYSSRQEIVDFVMVGDNPYSLTTRIAAWRIVSEIIRINPVLGLGPANYYWYTPLFPILGYSVRFSSHNNYVDIVAQTGLLGLSFFLWFVFTVAVVGFKLVKSLPAGFERAYVIGVLGGLTGTLAAGMFGDWMIPFVYNVGLNGLRASLIGWVFLGGLIALEQRSRNET